jgi:hypothetical protein
VRVVNNNVATAYLTFSKLWWNTAYAPPMYFDYFRFQGNRYYNPSNIYTSPVSASAPSIPLVGGDTEWWEADFNLNGQPFDGYFKAELTFNYPGWGTCTISGDNTLVAPPTRTPTRTRTLTPIGPTRTKTMTPGPTRTETLIPTITNTSSGCGLDC